MPYIKPPEYSRRAGRRKERRIRRQGLFNDKLRRRCGNCGLTGHNRRTCNGVVEEHGDVDSQKGYRQKQIERKNLKRTEKEINIALQKQVLRYAGRDLDDDVSEGDDDPERHSSDEDYSASDSETTPPRIHPCRRRSESSSRLLSQLTWGTSRAGLTLFP